MTDFLMFIRSLFLTACPHVARLCHFAPWCYVCTNWTSVQVARTFLQ